jgi:hypothetical protein
MKTARLSKILEVAGQPGNHVLLVSPETDRTLQQAIKTGRVMTIHQQPFGSKADYGTIGFGPGPYRQYLIFPGSLSAFAGSRVVGINYDLLSPGDSAKRPARPSAAERKAPRGTEGPKRHFSAAKIIKFENPERKKKKRATRGR